MKYFIKIVKGSMETNRAVQFLLYEGDCQIASGTRKAHTHNIRLKFFTINSETRFLTFCNTLSMTEVCEILPVRK